MQIHIISVGKKMPAWIDQGYKEYAKRLNQECSLNLIELTPFNRKQAASETIKAKEAELIKAAIPKGSLVIALDEHGKQHTTKQLANKLKGWLTSGQDVCLIIGGADGIDKSLLNEVNERWALSNLTLPHAMVRVLVAEQLYRAWSILKNHPYHRE